VPKDLFIRRAHATAQRPWRAPGVAWPGQPHPSQKVPFVSSSVTSPPWPRRLRATAGPHVPIIGLTYPDVLLGLWVYPPGAANRGLATLSLTAFRGYLNPALSAAYAKAGAVFVDITGATGAYTPLTETTTLAPYGTIPVAVAQVCTLTWYCSQGSIHASTAGYTFIGQQITTDYTRAQHR